MQFVVTGADSDYESTNRWDSNGGAWTLYITPTAAGTPVDIYISAPASTNAVGQMAAARMSRLRLGGDIPALTAAAAEASSTTVSLGHADSGGTGGTGADTPEIIGNQDYPTFTEADLVDTQTLNAGNKWQYQWTNLAPADPDGNKYYYYVVEEVPDGTQKVTYTRKEADGNTTVDITNKPVTNPQYGTLRVTKSVVASDGQELNRVFTIRLKQGDKYLQWTASDNYQWVTSQSDATTWTFNNGGSVTFTGLDLNQTYTVVEETGTGYVEIEGYQFLGAESTTSYSVEVASATATYEGTITNRYQLNDIDLQILKVDDKDMTTPLEGAQFTLRKLDPAGSGSYLTGDAEVTKTSSGTGGGDLTTTDGKATISGVKDGYYEISETKLPAGYVLTDSGKFYIKVVNGELTRLIPGDGPVTNWQPDTSTTGKIRYNADDGFIVGNKAGVELPTTGGKGTNLYTALGAALCLGSALVYGAGTVLGRRRKEGDGPA